MAVDNKKVKFEYRINQEIRSREVRLVGDNVEQGVYTVQEAQRIANDLELDLVEISISRKSTKRSKRLRLLR